MMDIYKESQDESFGLAHEQQLERERKTDPFRPLVLALLHQAEEEREKRKRDREGATELTPAQRTGNAKP